MFLLSGLFSVVLYFSQKTGALLCIPSACLSVGVHSVVVLMKLDPWVLYLGRILYQRTDFFLVIDKNV